MLLTGWSIVKSQVKSSQVIFIHKPLQVKVTNAQKLKNTRNTLKRLQGELKRPIQTATYIKGRHKR